MNWYKWLQQEGGEESWTLFLADQEEKLVREKKPAFTTILASDCDFSGKMDAEDFAKVHYKGPLYFDFDASSLDEAIEQFQKFLNKLKDDHGFDLYQASIYASGGKGFHCTIPPACFIPKVSPRGYSHLPAIYKEIAMELFVDCLDLRVYTARRGRQFRVANVERPDKPGIHKVPLSVEEALNLTEEQYREFVKAPRHVAPPSSPELNSGLALLWSQAFDKVDKGQKNKKTAKVDEAFLRKHGGNVPPTVLAVMNGEYVVDGIGFQKIATQLAITAHAMGKTEDQFLTLCAGLCANHVSDGVRYNTPEKRRRELARMYQYMHENPCYSFSIGGVKSLVSKECPLTDLNDGGVEITEEEQESEELEFSLTCGLRVNHTGIYKKTEEGLVKISAVGLAKPRQLFDAVTRTVLGYEVDIFVNGKERGSQILTMDTFLSRNKFVQFTLSTGGSSMSATDAQVGAIADILRTRAEKTGNEVYTVGREGLDLIMLPDGDFDLVWADNDGVISKRGFNYRLLGTFTDIAEYKTDIRRSPYLRPLEKSSPSDLIVDDSVVEYFEHLFRINQADVVGRLLGWYMAAFLAQPIRFLYDQFPLLQVFGQAGSGKTKTSILLAKLHYFRRKPVVASAMESTPFAMEALVTSSASVPLIFDEVKPREMSKDRLNKLRMLMRGNFNAADIKKGRVNTEAGTSTLGIKRGINGVPLVFIGEALESQTAIEDRCVIVSVSKDGKRDRFIDFRYCESNSEILSAFGRGAIDLAVNVDMQRLKGQIETQRDFVSEVWGSVAEDNDRPVFNTAVALTGLEFLRILMEKAFGTTFSGHIQNLREAAAQMPEVLSGSTMSEMAKVLDTLAYLSNLTSPEMLRYTLAYGEDYVVDPGSEQVELNLRNAYTKYMQYMRGIGTEPLFDNFDTFNAASLMYGGLRDKVCINSVLKHMPSIRVHAYSCSQMLKDGIGEFKRP